MGGATHRCSEDSGVVGGWSCPGWEGLRGASGGASVVATGKEPCRGGGRMRVRSQLRSAIYQVHSRQGPSRLEVSRGRLLGVFTPRGGMVSRKHKGRDLSGLQGTGSVKLGCLLPPSDVQRGAQVASEVWGCSSANLLLVEGSLALQPLQLHQHFCCQCLRVGDTVGLLSAQGPAVASLGAVPGRK